MHNKFVDIDTDGILKRFKNFRKKDIQFFIKKKIIEFPLTFEDLIKLDAIHKLWRSEAALRLQISGLKTKVLTKLEEYTTFGIESKIETWIYGQLKKNINLKPSFVAKQAVKQFKISDKNKAHVYKQLYRFTVNMKRRLKRKLSSQK